jgi:hypothetical protein
VKPRRTGLWLALVGALAMATAASAAAAECATAADAAALRSRAVQTELMVAALACEQRDNYNAFVERFRPALLREAQAFKAYFRRANGGAAEPAMSRFVTRLANVASQRSLADPAAFCAAAATAFDELSALEPQDYAQWVAARPAVALPEIGLCAASTSQ